MLMLRLWPRLRLELGSSIMTGEDSTLLVIMPWPWNVRSSSSVMVMIINKRSTTYLYIVSINLGCLGMGLAWVVRICACDGMIDRIVVIVINGMIASGKAITITADD